MQDELKLAFEKMSDAISKLEDGAGRAKDQLEQDGVIQRFEFSFELTWKTLKLFLIEQGIITRSPKEALKESFSFGLINDEEVFLDMLEDRNLTSHIYSEEISKKIFNRIKKSYLPVLKILLKELKKAIS